jgi:hypothetical protein
MFSLSGVSSGRIIAFLFRYGHVRSGLMLSAKSADSSRGLGHFHRTVAGARADDYPPCSASCRRVVWSSIIIRYIHVTDTLLLVLYRHQPTTIQCLLQVMTGGWPGAATDLVPRTACAMSSGGRTWMLGGARRGPCRSPARASGPGWADRVARLAGRRHSLLHATAMRTVSLWSSWCHSPNWCAPFVSWPCSDCVD